MSGSMKRAEFRGTALPLPGNDIDTDRIIPARYLKSIVFDGLGEHVFADDRAALERQGKRHPFDEAAYKGATILLVGDNFGCGSSREHAPQAIHRFGIQAIVGESFAEIFFGNCISVGMPCATATPADLAEVMRRVSADPRLMLHLDLEKLRLRVGDLEVTIQVPEGPRQAFINGTWDSTAELLQGAAQVAEVAARLPYVNEWQ